MPPQKLYTCFPRFNSCSYFSVLALRSFSVYYFKKATELITLHASIIPPPVPKEEDSPYNRTTPLLRPKLIPQHSMSFCTRPSPTVPKMSSIGFCFYFFRRSDIYSFVVFVTSLSLSLTEGLLIYGQLKDPNQNQTSPAIYSSLSSWAPVSVLPRLKDFPLSTL